MKSIATGPLSASILEGFNEIDCQETPSKLCLKHNFAKSTRVYPPTICLLSFAKSGQMRTLSRRDSCDAEMLWFLCPRCTRETDDITAKLVRRGIASDLLRRKYYARPPPEWALGDKFPCVLPTSVWRMWWSFGDRLFIRAFSCGKSTWKFCHQKNPPPFSLSKTPITKNFWDCFCAKTTKAPSPEAPDPKFLKKEQLKNTRKTLLLFRHFKYNWVFLQEIWDRDPGGSFGVFVDGFRGSGFWILVAGRAFRKTSP